VSPKVPRGFFLSYNTFSSNKGMTTKIKKRFVNVAPKTSLAKNRFVNQMSSLHAMEVEQENDTQLFVVSINRKYCFWMLRENDPHWEIIR